MKIFFKNISVFLLIGLVPLLVLSLGYLYFDPFKIVKRYNDYSYPFVIPNRDYISTEMLVSNLPKYHYNAFIFGSSRTLAFRPASWASHLPANSHPYMFDANIETIYGIYTKLRFLDSLHVDIKNALIILCRDASFIYETSPGGHLFIKDPKTTGESKLAFHFAFYKAYMSSNFLFCYYKYLLTKKFKRHMAGYIEYRKISYDTITNELRIHDQEEELSKDSVGYYARRKSIFYNRLGESIDTVQRISNNHLFMLTEIERLLEKSATNYKVVLSPLYEQVRFNPADLAILKNVFGDHLYDFSGKNFFTDNVYHFYEASHFRPVVGDSIMNIIYK